MKNICTRCGDSVGHRGTDTKCPSCQYVIKMEKKAKALDELELEINTYLEGLADMADDGEVTDWGNWHGENNTYKFILERLRSLSGAVTSKQSNQKP